ncbi:MAG TPA: transketolase [Vicinamibacteria bacterium]|nr:transketolase [Vicinamibacteria bacterium]
MKELAGGETEVETRRPRGGAPRVRTRAKAATAVDDATLVRMAQKLRRLCLESTAEAGSGHPTSCMSCAELVSVLFFREMQFDPHDPSGRDADVFVLSKGHAAPVLWAALKEAGAIDDDLLTLRRIDSRLEGHPTPRVPWARVATGSLGQGLCASAGMAWARKLDGSEARVYTLMGDGEAAEGSVWEAAEFASFYKLDNLCAIVDVNRLGQSGPTMYQHEVSVYEARLRAFGWNVAVVDGHDVRAIRQALGRAREAKGKPFGIVARTVKGKGVSFLEDKEGWHGKPVKKGEELERALAELGDTAVEIRVEPRRYPPAARAAAAEISLKPEYTKGQEVATREAYGTALAKLAECCPQVVALDGDTKNSTFSEKFKEKAPERFVEAYIAEQNMVGTALGAATEGKIPFASTFACFMTRAYDFLRMAGYSNPPHLVLCGSHSGISIGEDGPSQMGLEDLAMMRAIIASTVLYPSDAVSAERLVETAARTPGIVYLRTSRPKSPVLYDNDEAFPVGGSKTLRSSPGDAVTLVGAGITLHEALKAHEALAREGIAARVIDLYSVKPVDADTLRRAAAETRGIVTVEDHSAAGGIGEAVLAAVGGRTRVEVLAVREIPRSGKAAELLKAYGISADAVVAAARKLLAT